MQNPVNMGYLGVKTMVDHLQGRPVPKTVDTGVVMVTAETLGRSGDTGTDQRQVNAANLEYCAQG